MCFVQVSGKQWRNHVSAWRRKSGYLNKNYDVIITLMCRFVLCNAHCQLAIIVVCVCVYVYKSS